jgi:hypothetical protein
MYSKAIMKNGAKNCGRELKILWQMISAGVLACVEYTKYDNRVVLYFIDNHVRKTGQFCLPVWIFKKRQCVGFTKIFSATQLCQKFFAHAGLFIFVIVIATMVSSVTKSFILS